MKNLKESSESSETSGQESEGESKQGREIQEQRGKIRVELQRLAEEAMMAGRHWTLDWEAITDQAFQFQKACCHRVVKMTSLPSPYLSSATILHYAAMHSHVGAGQTVYIRLKTTQ